MTEFESPKMDRQLCSDLKQLIENNYFSDQIAQTYAHKIIALLGEEEVSVSTEEKTATYLSYREGPVKKEIHKDQMQIFNMVNKSLSPEVDEENTRSNHIVYKTNVKGLTIIWEQTLANTPGYIDHTHSLHRQADI